MKFIGGLFMFLWGFQASAQTEYFITLDESTGNFTSVNKFPTVSWIQPTGFAYCEANHHYTFCGSKDAIHWFLYTVDVMTGVVVAKPPFNLLSDTKEAIHNLTYSNTDKKLYALLQNRSANTISFIVIEPASGDYKIISQLYGIQYFTLDPGMVSKDNTRFMFLNLDSSNLWHLSSLGIADGKLLYSPVIPGNIGQSTYDDSLDKVIALVKAQDTLRLVSIDPTTGSVHSIRNNMPVNGYYGLSGSFAYNKVRQAYTFVGPDALGQPYIVTVNSDRSADLTASFPLVNKSGDNVIGFEYDNILGKMFAIHWESFTDKTSGLVVYPNPFFQKAGILLPKLYHSVAVIVYAVDGKLVKRLKFSETDNIVVDRNDLASGMYFIRVMGDGDEIGYAKLVAE